MEWFAVRSIFLFGKKRDGKNIIEERITVFEAEDPDAAFEKAAQEAEEYAKNEEREDFEIFAEMELYRQDGDPLIDGYEVWSQLFETHEDMATFFKNRYDKYEYTPDPHPIPDLI